MANKKKDPQFETYDDVVKREKAAPRPNKKPAKKKSK